MIYDGYAKISVVSQSVGRSFGWLVSLSVSRSFSLSVGQSVSRHTFIDETCDRGSKGFIVAYAIGSDA